MEGGVVGRPLGCVDCRVAWTGYLNCDGTSNGPYGKGHRCSLTWIHKKCLSRITWDDDPSGHPLKIGIGNHYIVARKTAGSPVVPTEIVGRGEAGHSRHLRKRIVLQKACGRNNLTRRRSGDRDRPAKCVGWKRAIGSLIGRDTSKLARLARAADGYGGCRAANIGYVNSVCCKTKACSVVVPREIGRGGPVKGCQRVQFIEAKSSR